MAMQSRPHGPSAKRRQYMTALIEPAPLRTNDTNSYEHSPGAGRDPAHVLYRHAAGLLASAQSREASTWSPGAVPATAATLACVETSLAALASAVGHMRGRTLERLSDPVLPNEDLRRQRAEIAFALERLAGVLDQGSFASARARAAIEPVQTSCERSDLGIRTHPTMPCGLMVNSVRARHRAGMTYDTTSPASPLPQAA